MERVMIDSDDDDDGNGNGDGESGVLGDEVGGPEGGQRTMDHQEIPRTSGNYDRVIPSSHSVPPVSTNTNVIPPLTLHRSIRTNRGIPHVQADEDPSLELGSRPMAKKDTNIGPTLVGIRSRTTNEEDPLPHADDGNMHALFLTVDAPHSYQEAMSRPYDDEWTAVISEEFHNLQ